MRFCQEHAPRVPSQRLARDPTRIVTLAAEAALIDAARRRARADNATLNAQFRIRLEESTGRDRRAHKAMEAVERLSASLRTGGCRFTRHEPNER